MAVVDVCWIHWTDRCRSGMIILGIEQISPLWLMAYASCSVNTGIHVLCFKFHWSLLQRVQLPKKSTLLTPKKTPKPALLSLWKQNEMVTSGFSSQRASNAESGLCHDVIKRTWLRLLSRADKVSSAGAVLTTTFSMFSKHIWLFSVVCNNYFAELMKLLFWRNVTDNIFPLHYRLVNRFILD